MDREIIYQYDGSFDGLMSCIYESYTQKERPTAFLSDGDADELCLFDVRAVQTDRAHAKRVYESFRKFSPDAGPFLRRVFLTCLPDKEMAIYRFVAKLYREGLFETVVLCGGVEWDTPFGRLLEADLMARIMLENGVPESAIVYDRQSTTTRENMLFGAVELGRRFRHDPPHEVGILTSPCHLRRSAALAEVYLPRIYRSCPVALPTPFDSPEEWTHDAFRAERVRHEAELLRRLVRTGVIPDIEF